MYHYPKSLPGNVLATFAVFAVALLDSACGGQAESPSGESSLSPAADTNVTAAQNKVIALDADCSPLPTPADGNISLSVKRGTAVVARLRYQQGANAFWKYGPPEAIGSPSTVLWPDQEPSKPAQSTEPKPGGPAVIEAVYDTSLLSSSDYELYFQCSAADGAAYVLYTLSLSIN